MPTVYCPFSVKIFLFTVRFLNFRGGMATPGTSAKKEKKKYIPTKTSFTSPFTPKWSSLPQEDMHFILKTLKAKLVSTGLEKKEVKVFRPWRKNRKAPPKPESVPQVSQDEERQESPKNGWTDVAARRQLAIGINEVTKALERNKLKLLLVCKSVKPSHMTNHLITLSATRGVPACQVPRLSQSMSEPLGLKSVLALGFKECAPKEDDVFADTVKVITPRVPSQSITWLHVATQSLKPEDPVEMDREEEGGEKRGQKRKLETESAVVTETAPSSGLQPLKVKKIVANPARKGKSKRKS